MIELLWNAPTSESNMSCYIDALGLGPEKVVLDVGCGCGEFIIRLHERFGISGTGIDVSPEHVEEAKRRAAGRVLDSAIQFLVADAQTYPFEQESIDLAVCMGATHAFGAESNAFQNAIEKLSALVVPSGMLLLADGYMKQSASPEYRKLLGDDIPDEMTHATNVAVGVDRGLIPLAAWTSSDNEWDNFEWGYQRIVEQHAIEQPDDSVVAARLSRRRVWMEAYLKWGRDTLGYGTYLFRKPAV